MSMAGFENNPKTMFVAGDMPFYMLNGYHGVGLQLMSDDIGLFKHQRLTAQYAYKCQMLGGTLSIGIQAGMLNEKFKGSGLDLEETDDPAFTKTDETGNALDMAAGLYYQHRQWYAGVSVLHATAPSIELGTRSIIDIARTYYLTGGYNIRLHKCEVQLREAYVVCRSGLQSDKFGDSAHWRNLSRRLSWLQLRGLHVGS